MRTLVLSDTHIGDPRYNNQHVISLLKKERYNRLVLAGDVIDLWLGRLKKIKKDPLFKFLKKISKRLPLIWVVGNHDYTAYILKPIKAAVIVESLEINEDGKRIFITHGNEVCFQKNQGRLGRFLTHFNMWGYKHVGWDVQTWFNGTKINEWLAESNRKKVLKKYEFGNDIIIMGHTHRMAHLKQSHVNLFDCGSPFIAKSYVIIQNGRVSLRIYDE